MSNAIGLIEVSSIAMGYALEDRMLKTASVELLVARTICSGKFLVAIGGDVAGVESSVRAAVADAGEGLISQVVIPNVSPAIFPAISGTVELHPEDTGALGIIETFSAVSAVEAADAAVKAASVTLFRLHLAMAVGGKGFALVAGDVAACRAAVEAGAQAASQLGLLVNRLVITGPRREIFREWI